MAYVIDQDRCINCWWCRRSCPTGTIDYFNQPNRKHYINPDGCIDCDICAQVCPMDCITHNPEITPTTEQLEAAKEKARRWAGERRRLKIGLRSYAESQIARIEQVAR
jgi:ferredoxin